MAAAAAAVVERVKSELLKAKKPCSGIKNKTFMVDRRAMRTQYTIQPFEYCCFKS